MMRLASLFLVATAALFFVACAAKPTVIVTDIDGVPIAGVTVEPVSASINYPSVETNARGEASIPKAVQPIQWINVKKEGFVTQMSVGFSDTKPVKVVLDR